MLLTVDAGNGYIGFTILLFPLCIPLKIFIIRNLKSFKRTKYTMKDVNVGVTEAPWINIPVMGGKLLNISSLVYIYVKGKMWHWKFGVGTVVYIRYS